VLSCSLFVLATCLRYRSLLILYLSKISKKSEGQFIYMKLSLEAGFL
jgi:hypothetical protein